MTSRNLFFKLMREDLKRRMWAVALLSLGFFFFYPVVAAFTAGEIRDYADYAKGLAEYERGLVRWLSFNCGMTVFLMMVAAMICGLSSFSFLNSKSKVDFYHGIPVRREKLFAANFLDGILMLAVPYGICQVLAVLVGISNGASGSKLWQVAIAAYGLHITYFILMYSTVVVAAMMTGHLVIGFLGAIVFASYMPMAIMLLIGYLSSFFATYAPQTYGLLSERVLIYGVRISPVAEYIYQLGRSGEQYQAPVSMVVPVLMAWAASFLLAALSCFLYRKRPSEAAGKAMAFSVTCGVIRNMLTMLSALGLGLFLYVIRNSLGWAIFGIVFGGGICHCVVEIIYHFDFKKLFSHKLQLVCCLAGSVAVMLVFKYDLLGYDRYTPKASQVREASVYVDRVTNWVSYGNMEKFPDGHYEWVHDYDDDYALRNMEYHDIENLLVIAREGIEQVQIQKKRKDSQYNGNYGYQENLQEDSEGDLWSQVRICYTLKSGRKVCRIYNMPVDGKAKQAVAKLYEDEEFQKGIFPLMTMAGDQVEVIRFRGQYSKGDNGEKDVCLENLPAEKRAQMLDVYQKEFSSMTVEQMEREAPIGLIRFSRQMDEEGMQWWKRQEANGFQEFPSYRYGGWRGLINKDYYPVYPSFSGTIGLLKEQGIETGGYLDELDVKAVRVRMMERDADRDYSQEYAYEEPVEYYYVKDPEKVRQLKECAVFTGLGYYDPFFQSEDMESSLMIWDLEEDENRDYEYVEYEDGNWNMGVEVIFPKGQVPEFLWEDIKAEKESKK